MSLLGQSQNAKDGSLAIQAARDVNIGPSVSEIKILVDAFVGNHLPALQQAAREEAERNVKKFLDEFVKQLALAKNISATEFAKPDSQNTFNEALRGCALKGDDSDLNLVSRILIERFSAEGKPLLKVVCEAAVRVLPSLTKAQISYLAFIQYTKHVRHKGLLASHQLELICKLIMPLVENGFRLSPANRQYLASIGVLTINPVANANLYPQQLRESYPFLEQDDQLRINGMTAILKFMDEFAAAEAAMDFLTSTGQLIGMQHLASVLGDVNMEIWIN